MTEQYQNTADSIVFASIVSGNEFTLFTGRSRRIEAEILRHDVVEKYADGTWHCLCGALERVEKHTRPNFLDRHVSMALVFRFNRVNPANFALVLDCLLTHSIDFIDYGNGTTHTTCTCYTSGTVETNEFAGLPADDDDDSMTVAILRAARAHHRALALDAAFVFEGMN